MDGIGATVKTILRKHIRARDVFVNSASDFVKAFNLTQSKIVVEETTDAEFALINSDLQTTKLFSCAKNIRNIFTAHQIQVLEGTPVIFPTSKQGYDLEPRAFFHLSLFSFKKIFITFPC